MLSMMQCFKQLKRYQHQASLRLRSSCFLLNIQIKGDLPFLFRKKSCGPTCRVRRYGRILPLLLRSFALYGGKPWRDGVTVLPHSFRICAARRHSTDIARRQVIGCSVAGFEGREGAGPGVSVTLLQVVAMRPRWSSRRAPFPSRDSQFRVWPAAGRASAGRLRSGPAQPHLPPRQHPGISRLNWPI